MRTIDLEPNPTGHAAPITHVALRPDGRRLASCSYDGTVLVWDTADPAHPARVTRLRHRRLVNASAWNPAMPNLLATASADKTVALWEVPDRAPARLVNVLARHTDDVNSVAWLPDGQRLVCVSEDGRATLWEALTGAYLAQIGLHAAHCMAVSVSCDGLVATVGEDGLVAVGAPDALGTAGGPEGSGGAEGSEGSGGPGGSGGSGTAVRRYACSVEGCAWSHAGTTLAVTRDDGAVDLLTSELDRVRTVRVSGSAARTVAWAEDDSAFVVGAYDGSLHFFDTAGTRLRTVDDARQWPRSVSTAGGLVAVGSFHSSPHLLEFATGTRLAGPAGRNHGPNALAVRHTARDGTGDGTGDGGGDGKRNAARNDALGEDTGEDADGDTDELLIGCDSGAVFTVDPSDATEAAEVRLRQTGDSPVLSLAAGNDAVYAGTYAGHVIRCGEDGEQTVGACLGAPVPSLCLAGDRLVAGTYNGELVSLCPETLTVLDRTAAHSGSVKSLAAFGDGGVLSAATDRTVAAGSPHARVTLWEHGNLVNAVAGLDGRVVASASRDHTVKVGRVVPAGTASWQLERLQTLLGPDESVKCVSLLGDPDSPVVLAGSYDFGLYEWEVDWDDGAATLASGRLLAAFRQGVSSMVRLSARRVAVAGWDGRILLVGPDAGNTVRVLHTLDVGDLAVRSLLRREAVAG